MEERSDVISSVVRDEVESRVLNIDWAADKDPSVFIVHPIFTPDEQALLEQWFPELILRFEGDCRNGHAMAAVTRQCMTRLMLLDAFQRGNTVVDVGGNPLWHVRWPQLVHSCTPLLAGYDAKRHSERCAIAEQRLACTTSVESDPTVRSRLEQVTDVYSGRSELTSFLCKRKSEECTVSARTLIASDSIYDIRPENVALMLLNHRADAFYASVLEPRGLLLGADSGVIPELNTTYSLESLPTGKSGLVQSCGWEKKPKNKSHLVGRLKDAVCQKGNFSLGGDYRRIRELLDGRDNVVFTLPDGQHYEHSSSFLRWFFLSQDTIVHVKLCCATMRLALHVERAQERNGYTMLKISISDVLGGVVTLPPAMPAVESVQVIASWPVEVEEIDSVKRRSCFVEHSTYWTVPVDMFRSLEVVAVRLAVGKDKLTDMDEIKIASLFHQQAALHSRIVIKGQTVRAKAVNQASMKYALIYAILQYCIDQRRMLGVSKQKSKKFWRRICLALKNKIPDRHQMTDFAEMSPSMRVQVIDHGSVFQLPAMVQELHITTTKPLPFKSHSKRFVVPERAENVLVEFFRKRCKDKEVVVFLDSTQPVDKSQDELDELGFTAQKCTVTSEKGEFANKVVITNSLEQFPQAACVVLFCDVEEFAQTYFQDDNKDDESTGDGDDSEEETEVVEEEEVESSIGGAEEVGCEEESVEVDNKDGYCEPILLGNVYGRFKAVAPESINYNPVFVQSVKARCHSGVNLGTMKVKPRAVPYMQLMDSPYNADDRNAVEELATMLVAEYNDALSVSIATRKLYCHRQSDVRVAESGRFVIEEDLAETDVEFVVDSKGVRKKQKTREKVFVHNCLKPFYARIKLAYLKVPYKHNSTVEVRVVNGLPGTGKTRMLIELAKGLKDCAVVTATASTKEEISREISGFRVHTADGQVAIAKTAKVLLIDEIYMLPKGAYLAVLSQVRPVKVITFGDVEQIPFIARNAFDPQHSTIVFDKIHFRMNISRRLTRATAGILSHVYNDIATTNSSTAVLEAKFISSVGEIPWHNFRGGDVQVLVLTQGSKAKLLARYRGLRVMTYHEAQGCTFDTVVLVREGTEVQSCIDGCEASKKITPHNLVAVSRSRGKVTYYTAKRDDLYERIRKCVKVREVTKTEVADEEVKNTRVRLFKFATLMTGGAKESKIVVRPTTAPPKVPIVKKEEIAMSVLSTEKEVVRQKVRVVTETKLSKQKIVPQEPLTVATESVAAEELDLRRIVLAEPNTDRKTEECVQMQPLYPKKDGPIDWTASSILLKRQGTEKRRTIREVYYDAGKTIEMKVFPVGGTPPPPSYSDVVHKESTVDDLITFDDVPGAKSVKLSTELDWDEEIEKQEAREKVALPQEEPRYVPGPPQSVWTPRSVEDREKMSRAAHKQEKARAVKRANERTSVMQVDENRVAQVGFVTPPMEKNEDIVLLDVSQDSLLTLREGIERKEFPIVLDLDNADGVELVAMVDVAELDNVRETHHGSYTFLKTALELGQCLRVLIKEEDIWETLFEREVEVFPEEDLPACLLLDTKQKLKFKNGVVDSIEEAIVSEVDVDDNRSTNVRRNRSAALHSVMEELLNKNDFLRTALAATSGELKLPGEAIGLNFSRVLENLRDSGKRPSGIPLTSPLSVSYRHTFVFDGERVSNPRMAINMLKARAFGDVVAELAILRGEKSVRIANYNDELWKQLLPRAIERVAEVVKNRTEVKRTIKATPRHTLDLEMSIFERTFVEALYNGESDKLKSNVVLVDNDDGSLVTDTAVILQDANTEDSDKWKRWKGELISTHKYSDCYLQEWTVKPGAPWKKAVVLKTLDFEYPQLAHVQEFLMLKASAAIVYPPKGLYEWDRVAFETGVGQWLNRGGVSAWLVKPLLVEIPTETEIVPEEEVVSEMVGTDKEVLWQFDGRSGISYFSYTPEFVEEEDAQGLFQLLMDKIVWRRQRYRDRQGNMRAEPRQVYWIGDESYGYSSVKLEANAFWPGPLRMMRDVLSKKLGVQFNSVLLNYYKDGQESVGWHADDEDGLGEKPVIASVSLGASRLFEIKQKGIYGRNVRHEKFVLDSGSLMVMSGASQLDWLHSVPRDSEVNDARINLTFRVHTVDEERRRFLNSGSGQETVKEEPIYETVDERFEEVEPAETPVVDKVQLEEKRIPEGTSTIDMSVVDSIARNGHRKNLTISEEWKPTVTYGKTEDVLKTVRELGGEFLVGADGWLVRLKKQPQDNVYTAFYDGKTKTKPDGMTIAEILARDDKWWDTNHNFIQWLFPNCVQGLNPAAPPATQSDLFLLGASLERRKTVVQAVQRVCAFWGLVLTADSSVTRFGVTVHGNGRLAFLNKSQHNWLRVTRLLKFLGGIGMPELQRIVGDKLIDLTRSTVLRNAVESADKFWKPALTLQKSVMQRGRQLRSKDKVSVEEFNDCWLVAAIECFDHLMPNEIPMKDKRGLRTVQEIGEPGCAMDYFRRLLVEFAGRSAGDVTFRPGSGSGLRHVTDGVGHWSFVERDATYMPVFGDKTVELTNRFDWMRENLHKKLPRVRGRVPLKYKELLEKAQMDNEKVLGVDYCAAPGNAAKAVLNGHLPNCKWQYRFVHHSAEGLSGMPSVKGVMGAVCKSRLPLCECLRKATKDEFAIVDIALPGTSEAYNQYKFNQDTFESVVKEMLNLKLKGAVKTFASPLLEGFVQRLRLNGEDAKLVRLDASSPYGTEMYLMLNVGRKIVNTVSEVLISAMDAFAAALDKKAVTSYKAKGEKVLPNPLDTGVITVAGESYPSFEEAWVSLAPLVTVGVADFESCPPISAETAADLKMGETTDFQKFKKNLKHSLDGEFGLLRTSLAGLGEAYHFLFSKEVVTVATGKCVTYETKMENRKFDYIVKTFRAHKRSDAEAMAVMSKSMDRGRIDLMDVAAKAVSSGLSEIAASRFVAAIQNLPKMPARGKKDFVSKIVTEKVGCGGFCDCSYVNLLRISKLNANQRKQLCSLHVEVTPWMEQYGVTKQLPGGALPRQFKVSQHASVPWVTEDAMWITRFMGYDFTTTEKKENLVIDLLDFNRAHVTPTDDLAQGYVYGQPVYSEEDSLLLMEPKVAVGVLKTFVNNVTPGNATVDSTWDSHQMEMGDIDLTSKDAQVRVLNTIAKPKVPDVVKPEIVTGVQAPYSNTFKSVATGFSKRNADPPKLLNQVPSEDKAVSMWEAMKRNIFRDDAEERLKKFQDDAIGISLEGLRGWLANHDKDAKISQLVSLVESGHENFQICLDQNPLDVFELTIKTNPKTVVSTSQQNELQKPQMVLASEPLVTALVSNVFQTVQRRFEELCLPQILLPWSRNSINFNAALDHHLKKYTGILLMATEKDLKAFDKSQQEAAHIFKNLVYRQLGAADQLIEMWEKAHERNVNIHFATATKFYLWFQHKSGDATTLLGNTLINLGLFCVAYDTIPEFIAAVGDDSLFKVQSAVSEEMAESKYEQWNFEVKRVVNDSAYFCGAFVVKDTITGSYALVKDPMKVLYRLGSMSVQSYEQLADRFLSLKDEIKDYERPGLRVAVADAVAERYDCTMDCLCLVECLRVACTSEEAYAQLWDLPVRCMPVAVSRWRRRLGRTPAAKLAEKFMSYGHRMGLM